MLGPLFYKELLEIARRRRYFVARVAVGIALLAGWWLFMGGQQQTFSSTNLTAMAHVGRSLFQGWAYFSLIAGILLAPALVCGLIAGEKDNRTFDVLLTTLLTSREILVGKMASRLALFAVLLGSSIPILGLASLYGGFDVAQVLASACVIFGHVFLAMLFGLYYSTVTFKPYIALLRTYFVLAILWWVLPAAARQFSWFDYFNPTTTLIAAFEIDVDASPAGPGMPANRFNQAGNTMPFGRGGGMRNPWTSFNDEPLPRLLAAACLHFAIALALLTRTALVLRHRLSPGKPPWFLRFIQYTYAAIVGGARGFVKQHSRMPGLSQLWRAESLTEAWSQSRRETIGDRSPLALRNASANIYDPERYVTAFQIIVFIGTIAYFALSVFGTMSFYRDELGVLQQGYLSTLVFHMLCSIVLASCSFAREKQSGSWDLLLLADLRPAEHWKSAVAGVFWVMRPLTVLWIVLLIMTASVALDGSRLIYWITLAVVYWRYVVSIALYASAVHSRINHALCAAIFAIAGSLALDVGTFAFFQFLYFHILDDLLLRNDLQVLAMWSLLALPGLLGIALFVRFVNRYWKTVFLIFIMGIVAASGIRYAKDTFMPNQPAKPIYGPMFATPHIATIELLGDSNGILRMTLDGQSRSNLQFYRTVGDKWFYDAAACIIVILLETAALRFAAMRFFPRLHPSRPQVAKSPAAAVS